MLLVADRSKTLLISGTGDVIEPADDALAIGSGGPYAYAAALAYLDGTTLSAAQIAEKSLRIAGTICIYTNDHITLEELA
jgi:ATP-dependent HslUV protease subunit HslV